MLVSLPKQAHTLYKQNSDLEYKYRYLYWYFMVYQYSMVHQFSGIKIDIGVNKILSY